LIQSYAFDKEFHSFLKDLVATAVRSVDQQQLPSVPIATTAVRSVDQQQLPSVPIATAAVAAAAAATTAVNATATAVDDTSDLPWQQLTHVNVATVTGDSGMNDSNNHNDHADIETSSDRATSTAVTTAGNKRKVLSPDASSNVSEVR
jgi:hypothetical protein